MPKKRPGQHQTRTLTDTLMARSTTVVVGSIPGTATPVVKGEPDTSTVEARLLTDPSVVWVGTHEAADWKARWGTGTDTWTSNQTVADYPARATRGKALRITHVPGTTNGFGAHRSFALMGIPDMEEAYFRYRVNFEDFAFINLAGKGGGKLPGLAGKMGTMPTYDSKVGSGGQRFLGNTYLTTSNYLTADGWSGRILWEKDKGLQSYLYIPDAAHLGTTGDPTQHQSYFGYHARLKTFIGSSVNATVNPTGWNDIELHYKLNDPGLANGVFEMWLNGVKGLSLSTLVYRTETGPQMKITQIYDANVYGGTSADSPDSTTYSYLDDYVISSSYIGPRSD